MVSKGWPELDPCFGAGCSTLLARGPPDTLLSAVLHICALWHKALPCVVLLLLHSCMIYAATIPTVSCSIAWLVRGVSGVLKSWCLARCLLGTWLPSGADWCLVWQHTPATALLDYVFECMRRLMSTLS
jgi:hypothetical protein